VVPAIAQPSIAAKPTLHPSAMRFLCTNPSYQGANARAYSRQREPRRDGLLGMRGLLLLLTILGACTEQGDWIDVDFGPGTMILSGDQINILYVNAKVTGPMLDGSPYTLGGPAQVLTSDWTVVDTLQLTTGDQVWHDGDYAYLVDTRMQVPASLFDHCAELLQIQITLGAQMADDGHVESSTGVTTAPLLCY
jgi:hypothetical protein